ncbi:MAG: NAD(P)H-hydrate epimerase [Planctomycetia bacterium]|nr:NAD(P)H-hydrate epimerase [Planctomycetia bacterium]
MNIPPILSCQETQKIDELAIQEYHVPGLILMENAGRGITDKLCSRGVQGETLIFCGTGNNAGDGMVIARQMAVRNHPVHVFLCAPPQKLKGDALTQYIILQKIGIPITALHDIPEERLSFILQPFLKNADWIIDALLGTGAKGSPRTPINNIIRWINASQKRILSVDLPSGLNADTGIPFHPCIQANITCTLSSIKPGFQNPASTKFTGEVLFCDIGFPLHILFPAKIS